MASEGGAALRLERVCRGCLKETPHLRPLSTPTDPPLHQMLASSTQLQISENDGLPYQICSNCLEQLSMAFSFKQMCHQSDAKLRRYMSNIKGKVKEEESHVINGNNGIIGFNSTLEPVSSIKEEQTESQNLLNDTDDKLNLSFRLPNKEQTKNLISINEKCIQTKVSDLFKTLYNCADCGKKFSSLIGITNHMKWRHKVKELFSCNECEAIYKNFSQYKKHLSDVHKMNTTTESNTSPIIECQICKKVFYKLNQLKQHMLIHGKKKIFNCDKCHQGFNKSENFEKHKVDCDENHFCSKSLTNLEMDSQAVTVHHDQDAIDDDVKNSLESNTKNSQNSKDSDDMQKLNGADINIKEEPLDELLAEAERDTQILNEDSHNTDNGYDRDDDFLSLEDYSEAGQSDSSEYLESLKLKRKNKRPSKKNKKPKLEILKQCSKNDSTLKYQCTTCSKRFSTSVGLKIHSAKHYNEQGLLYTCEVCGETFSKSIQLKQHERVHLSGKQFKCSSCDKSFHSQDNLAKHMLQHMDNKPHKCDKCDKSFLRIEHLARHNLALHSGKVKNPKTAFCSICKRGFTTEKYLETHMRMHTGDKTFTCKVCDKSFNTKWHLKEHSKWHTAEKPFLCSKCGQSFIRNDYLITHMRRHNGEKPYKCRFCGKGFPRATDLTVHERYHTGEKTHLCTICGKGFQRQYNLTVHLRVHTGEKPYACSYCGKRFAQGNDLKSHVRRHTGERFNCEICGEGFIQGYHLTQHKRSIHGLQCVSHIRRVEKHIQTASQNQSKHRLQSPQPEQTNSNNNSEISANNTSAKKESIPANSKEKPIMITLSTKIENDSIGISDHHAISFQSEISNVQSGVSEVDLSQRSHTMPALMPLVPLALFTPMHSRI